MSAIKPLDSAAPKHLDTTAHIVAEAKLGLPTVAQPSSVANAALRDRFLSDKDVAHRYQVGKQTIWRWARTSSSFPRPIKVEGTTRWSELELDEHDRKLKGARR